MHTRLTKPALRTGLQVAASDLGSCLLILGVDFLLYCAAISIGRPKYLFLFGNALLVALVLIQASLAFFLAARLSGFDRLSFSSALHRILIAGLAMYGLHVTVFTITERSVSMNVLRFLAAAPRRSYDEIEGNFVGSYVNRDQAVCQRLDEQIHLGNISREEGRYSLSARGLWTFRALEITDGLLGDRRGSSWEACPRVR